MAFGILFISMTQLTLISLVAINLTLILAWDKVSNKSAETLGLPIIPAP